MEDRVASVKNLPLRFPDKDGGYYAIRLQKNQAAID